MNKNKQNIEKRYSIYIYTRNILYMILTILYKNYTNIIKKILRKDWKKIEPWLSVIDKYKWAKYTSQIVKVKEILGYYSKFIQELFPKIIVWLLQNDTNVT